MTNHACNQFNSLPADSILEAEKIRFLKAFTQEKEVVYPKDTDLLKAPITVLPAGQGSLLQGKEFFTSSIGVS